MLPVLMQTWITPTYVGNTTWSTKNTKELKDHPHLRGEYTVTWLDDCLAWGSPPPTWGIPFNTDVPFDEFGITPTYVGNT